MCSGCGKRRGPETDLPLSGIELPRHFKMEFTRERGFLRTNVFYKLFIQIGGTGWSAVRRRVTTQRNLLGWLIVALLASGAFLLAPLAAIFSHPVRTAHAQSLSPLIDSDLFDYTVPAGEYLYAGFVLKDFPCVDQNGDDRCDYNDKFTSVSYRFDVLHRAGGADANSCEGQGLGGDRSYSPASYDDWRSLGPIPLRITKDCQPGLYTLRLGVTYTEDANQSQIPIETVDFVVGDPPPPNPDPNPQEPQNPYNLQHPHSPPSSIAPDPEGPVVVTLPDQTNVRLGPGTEYETVRSVPYGTRARVLGLGPWHVWYLVEIDGIYSRVWICQDLTVLSSSLTGMARIILGGVPTAPALTSRW